MINKEIIAQNNKKTKIKIHSFLDRAGLLGNKKEFIERVIKDIKSIDLIDNFAGFLSEKNFEEYIKKNIFSEELSKEYPQDKLNFDYFISGISETINKIKEFIGSEVIEIYIFPTNSKYTKEKMNGCSGRLVWKDVIYLEIYPTEKIKDYIKSSLAHEIAHNCQEGYSFNMSIGDAIIFEGIAEHFQEKFIGEVKNPWTTAINENRAEKIFNDIKSKLDKTYTKEYRRIFYGTGRYPLWAGYTIGYLLVKKFLNKSSLTWSEILKLNPKTILKIS